ncbi:hypothetical protein [Tepidimicrobium xylanilyticum]|uniref:hypothetical protein n=1 Tax=Tepidimicrobium xylanilyticum TaxID=1123352 RepID=UPI002650E91F|nr:hypothetical protein [Tepidimicrobium xylanilyticum]GMG96865.1 hypothetical protein EN5CB1_16910 [Tepidimicrobium xylanilyticum]
MAYNTKEIIKDKDGNPISQYYNPDTDQYEPVEGSHGANKVLVENNELSLIPILDKLSQLTGTVIDEEIRKSNEQTRQSNEQLRIQLYNDLLTELERIEQIDKQVPETVIDSINALKDKLGELQDLDTTEKSNLVLALNEIYQDLVAHKAESVTHKVSNRKPTATDDETQNIKQGDIWIYENYINEEEYEFIAYQCMDNKAGMAKWEKYVEKVAVSQKIYGVRIDKNNSNPETRVTYIGNAVGFQPMRGNNGNFSWGSWKEVFESFEIRSCVLKNGVVQYYLNPNDFTKKADGSNSNLTGADGDVMIEFGKTLWWKWTDEGTTYTIEISDKEFDGAVKHAFEIEEGYNLVPYYALLLTQILFVIFFKSTDSQAALGRGRVDGAEGYAATGGINTKGMFYGSEADEQMKFLGIEDYWGNKFWWIDGLVTDSNYNLLIGKGSFNDNGSGYQPFTSGVSSDTSGYIDSVQGGNEKGFIIKSNSGSETTYYADRGDLYSGRVARFGGSRSFGSFAGFACLRLDAATSDAVASFGARLFCASNGKIYIGAYLGTSVSGKLRSISGTAEPTGSKTIGTFRTEARANN